MHIVFDARRIHAVTSRGRYTTRQPGVMAECRVIEAKSKFSQDGNASLLGVPECGRGDLGLGIDDCLHIDTAKGHRLNSLLMFQWFQIFSVKPGMKDSVTTRNVVHSVRNRHLVQSACEQTTSPLVKTCQHSFRVRALKIHRMAVPYLSYGLRVT
jgi:hypothetical protein